jgi:hypothetical protein
MDNFDWDDYRHQVMQVAIIWAKTHKDATKIAGKWGFEVYHGMLDSGGRYKTVKDALKGWKDNQRGNKPHKYNEIDFAVKNGKMKKANIMADFDKGIDEGYKMHYPSLKKLTQLQYTDPRVATEGRKVHAERAGNFTKGDTSIAGHYVVYEDTGFPGTYIGVHIGSELSEDGGDAPINVVAMDTSRAAVVNRVAYRARRSTVAENEILDEGFSDVVKKVKDSLLKIFSNKEQTDEKNKAAFGEFLKGMKAFLADKQSKKYAKDRRNIDKWVKTIEKYAAQGDYDVAKRHAERFKKAFNKMADMKSLGTEVGPDGKAVSNIWEAVFNEDSRDVPKDKSSYQVVNGSGNAVASHKKALAQALKDHKGKAKEKNALFHTVSGGPHGTYTVRTEDNGGKIKTWIVFN